MEEVINVVSAIVVCASTISAITPEPKTRFGKRMKRIVDLLAVNVGHAKNKGVDQ